MITPERRFTMRRAAACATRNVPLRLVSMIRSHVASSSSRNGTIGSMAALVTAISMRPHLRSTAARPSSTELLLDTSICRARPRAPRRRATAVAVLGSMSAQARRAPSRARASAIASPMPRPAPVTSATLSFNLIVFSGPLRPHLLRWLGRRACGVRGVRLGSPLLAASHLGPSRRPANASWSERSYFVAREFVGRTSDTPIQTHPTDGAAARSVGGEDEVGGDGALVGLGVELGDEGFVVGGGDAHVEVWGAAGVTAGRDGFVGEAALGVGVLRGAQLVAILAALVGRPPFDARTRQRGAALRRAHGAGDDDAAAGP